MSLTTADQDHAPEVSWYKFACAYVDMKWDEMSPNSRRSIADALATATMTLLTGRQGAPNLTQLRGYALHELLFAILFLAIVAVPLWAGQRWAWWASWSVLIGYLGYALTFGVHDGTILARSLIDVIALPVLLLAQLPP